MSISPVHEAGLATEEDVASYLISHPEFFVRFAEVLGTVRLANPHGGNTVSLHERQTAMLREKIKKLEASIVEMMGYGSENAHTIDKARSWATAMLRESDPARLPEVLAMQLRILFEVPGVYLRLWDLDAAYADLPEVRQAEASGKSHIAALKTPYCGPRGSVEGLQSLAGSGVDVSEVQSIALLPIRAGALEAERITFGYLLLVSPDGNRFRKDMGLELLTLLSELGSAAMERLLPAETIDRLKDQQRLARQQDGQGELPLE